jgi:hypothetical protein
MKLTSTQITALANHMKANTNLTPTTDTSGNTLPAAPFQINTFCNLTSGQAGFRDPSLQLCVAAWYNQPALGTDNQPFANLNVWNPLTSIQQLKSAQSSFSPLSGAGSAVLQGSTPTDAQVTNALTMWEYMIWDLGPPQTAQAATLPPVGLDFGDAQIRKGILLIWGDVTTGASVAQSLGAVGCGQQVGRNIELVLSNAVTTPSAGGAFLAAHPVQKDVLKKTIYGQVVTQLDVDFVLFPNG